MIKQKLLDIQSANLENHIVWIPDHSGILGNETADHLAKRAITHGQLLRRPLSHTDLFSILRTEFIADSSKFLKNQGRRKGHKYFLNFEELCLKPWFHKLNLSRESIVTCCRIRSNHALNHSLHRCNLIQDPRLAYAVSLRRTQITSSGAASS
ncbi:pol-like protein [Lasius niger]|uniref:Pol-like protein n=1 Tax=Lasius niger TaxID=67767 RepID=A0A0J7JYL8_LASNI|nr:pol-like protein [Lasius niger]